MPRGIPNQPRSSNLIGPSDELTKIEQAIADLKARQKAELVHHRQRALLVRFLKKHTLLTRRDVNDAIDAAGRGKRQKGDKAVVSRHAGLAVAKVISDARTAKGLTRQALGRKVGVSGQTVGNWERGQQSGVPDDKQPKLAKVLGISVKALANGDARPSN